MGDNMELLGAQAHVWNHALKFCNSMALKCAVEMRIPDVMHSHGEAISLSSLAAKLKIVEPTKVECVGRLMRLLVHSGFFAAESGGDGISNKEEEEEVKYSLRPPSRLLVRQDDNPLQVAPFLFLNLDRSSLVSWDSLSSWLCSSNNNCNNAFEMANGKSAWEYVAEEERMRNIFHQSMVCDPKLIGRALTTEYVQVLEGLESLVDVGGGAGVLANTIVQALPNINYIVFDLPQIVANLQPTTDNITYVGGDMFQSKIPPANAVLLKSVLHNWNDDESIKILKNCKDAIPNRGEGGKIIIIDMVMDNKLEDEKSTETQIYFDLVMMATFASKQRNLRQWKNLFLQAGFTDFKIVTNNLGLRSIIEVYP